MTWEELNTAIAEKVTAAKATVNTEGMSPKDIERAENAALAAELRNMEHSVRQFLHDGGHSQATATNAEKLRGAEEAKKALEATKKDLEKQLEEARAKLVEVEAKTPDIAAQREKLQAEFADREKQLQEKVTAAEAKVTDLEDARKADRVDGFVNRLHARLGSSVTDDGQEWVKNKIDRMRLDGRLQPKITEGAIGVAVLRPNSTELEYHASNEDELLTVVSTEVLEGAPKWAVKANVIGGGGALPGNGKGANRWDKIREETAKRGVVKDQETLNKRKTALLGTD